MKKVFMKSFLGIPFTIFLYEMINIVISITEFESQYFRLDMFNFTEIIITYVALAILGYALTFFMHYDRLLRNSGKAEHEIAKKYVKAIVALFIFMLLIVGIISYIYPDSYAIPIASIIILVVFGLINMVQGFVDGTAIKKINQKIK